MNFILDYVNHTIWARRQLPEFDLESKEISAEVRGQAAATLKKELQILRSTRTEGKLGDDDFMNLVRERISTYETTLWPYIKWH